MTGCPPTKTANTVSIGDDGTGGPDQDPSDNDGSDMTPVDGTPMLEVLKTAEQPSGDGYMPGDVFMWTLEVLNTGNQDIANLTLLDTLPAEVLYEIESMVLDGVPQTDLVGDDAASFDGVDTLTVDIALVAAGESVVLTFLTAVSGQDPDEDGMVRNQAVVTDQDGNNTPSDDPNSMEIDDPTVVPIVLFVIPTLDAWGLLALIALMATLSLGRMRRRRV